MHLQLTKVQLFSTLFVSVQSFNSSDESYYFTSLPIISICLFNFSNVGGRSVAPNYRINLHFPNF